MSTLIYEIATPSASAAKASALLLNWKFFMRKQVRSSRYSSSYLAKLLVDFLFIPAQYPHQYGAPIPCRPHPTRRRRDSGDDDEDDGGGGGNGTMISPDTGVLHFLLTPLGTSMFEFKQRPTPAPIKLVVLLFMPEQDLCARTRPGNMITKGCYQQKTNTPLVWGKVSYGTGSRAARARY